jgi:hypothetical protein
VEPFLDLLEGGKGGGLHNDIIEYFYYCQLKTQPDDSMESWKMRGEADLMKISIFNFLYHVVSARLLRSCRRGGRSISPPSCGLLPF